MLDAGRVRSPLGPEDLAFLKRYGVLRAEVWSKATSGARWRAIARTIWTTTRFDAIAPDVLGARLTHGIFMTGGFFLGPNDFYERLRTMPAQELAKIDMTRIDFINQLYGGKAT